MTIAHKIFTSILTISTITATILLGAAFQQGKKQEANIPTVTITAKKMTEQQKIAYDESQSVQNMQTVIVKHQRLNASEKFAFDQLDRQIQQTSKSRTKKPALLV